MSTTANYSKPSHLLSPCCSKRRSPRPLHPTVEESILDINNEGVSLLQAGHNKAAMIRLARCLAIMRSRSVEGEKEVHYQFTRPIPNYTLSETSNSTSRYIFAAPLVVVTSHQSSCDCCSNNEQQLICKLLSLVLFNLSLAHHLYALELKVQETFQRTKEVCDLLEKSLRLYELCHSSLVFTNSGLLCSDLSIAVVVTNNVGEIHKELHQRREQNRNHEYSRTAMACSEQLVQIFMFFAANGSSKQLEGFGDILSNAMATLNGPQIVAPAA